MKINCFTCKYGYEDERLGIPLCHHPKRFSEDCVNFNMHEEKETEESENPINLDDAMKELDEKIALVKQRGTWDGVDVDKYMDEVRGRESEKPMNLEEEIIRYLHEECSDDDEPGIHEIAEHFAEWGYLRAAEKYNEIEYNRQRAEESVPNDLEKAAKEYAKTTFKKPYSDNPDEEVTIVEPDKYAGFIAGARHEDEQLSEKIAAAYQLGLADKEKQMMKEAVEGKIIFLLNGDVAVNIGDTDKYNLGQKIRVIVLPKED